MLNGWFSSSRCFSSSHGSGLGRAGAFMLILAIADGRASACFLDRILRNRYIGDLLEGQLLVRREVAIIDVVLVCPFGALAHEAFVHREDAVLRQDVDCVF